MANPYGAFCIDPTHPTSCTCDILDKRDGINSYVRYMYDRTNQMFEYDGLPDTIPAYLLELYLQIYGCVAIARVESELYCLYGNVAGAPDPYNRPTLFVYANAGLGKSATLRIENNLPPFANREQWNSSEPCILFRNDTNCEGLLPLYARYATQLVENDISIRSAQINARQQTLIAASTDREKESAEQYIKNLESGKLSAVAENAFLTGIRAENVSTMSSNSIIQLIELQQYLKASWFNDIGLNANFNMKREYLSTEEIQASTDVLLPLADDMLRCRKDACDAINKLFGTNISVRKNSAWDNKEKEIEAARAETAEETGGDPNAEEGDNEPVS